MVGFLALADDGLACGEITSGQETGKIGDDLIIQGDASLADQPAALALGGNQPGGQQDIEQG